MTCFRFWTSMEKSNFKNFSGKLDFQTIPLKKFPHQNLATREIWLGQFPNKPLKISFRGIVLGGFLRLSPNKYSQNLSPKERQGNRFRVILMGFQRDFRRVFQRLKRRLPEDCQIITLIFFRGISRKLSGKQRRNYTNSKQITHKAHVTSLSGN